MTSKPRTGSKFTYDAPTTLGEAHMDRKAADARRSALNPDEPDDQRLTDSPALALSGEQVIVAEYHRQMHELDLHPGTEVKVAGYDDDRDLVLVEWTDKFGTPRITSVEPDHFNDAFTKGA